MITGTTTDTEIKQIYISDLGNFLRKECSKEQIIKVVKSSSEKCVYKKIPKVLSEYLMFVRTQNQKNNILNRVGLGRMVEQFTEEYEFDVTLSKQNHWYNIVKERRCHYVSAKPKSNYKMGQ